MPPEVRAPTQVESDQSRAKFGDIDTCFVVNRRKPLQAEMLQKRATLEKTVD